MAIATAIRFSPSKILSQDRGYKVYVTVVDDTNPGGQPERFSGPLEYDVRVSWLDSLSQCRALPPGTWQAQGGEVAVVAQGPIRPGIFMARVRPTARAGAGFSNWDIILVDDRPTLNPNVAYTPATIGLPPPGAYMIFENVDRVGQVVGYSRLDIETTPCILGGTTMRFAKTRREAYWDPNNAKSLRWCVRDTHTPVGNWTVASGGLIYQNHWAQLGASRPAVTYDGGALGEPSTQSLLGGFPEHAFLASSADGTASPLPPHNRLDIYRQPRDMWLFYALLPEGRRVPANLSNTPRTIVDLAFGRPNNDVDLDLWHAAAMAPTTPDAVLRMRYGEFGIRLLPPTTQLKWQAMEEWEWRADGLITRIAQWRNVPPLCWRAGNCPSAQPDITLRLIDAFVPDGQPLSLRLTDPSKAQTADRVDLAAGGNYHLLVSRSDGKPYSGFLEIEVLALQTSGGDWQALPAPSRQLWREASLHPIYVSHGHVNIGFAAHRQTSGFGVFFRVRPFLTNASLNTLFPLTDRDVIPNASTAPFSNHVALTIGSNTPIGTQSLGSLVPGLVL